MVPVIALALGAELRERLTHAVGADVDVIFCERAPQLADLLALHGALAVVTELVDEAGAFTGPTISELNARIPDLQIIVLHDRTVLEPGELLEMGRLGVSAWIHRAARDFTPAMREALALAELRTPAAAILDRALPHVPADLQPFFVHCAHAAVRPLKVEQAARGAGFAPRTLRTRLSRRGLPAPWQIVRWNRMLHALWRLELSGRPVKRVAAGLGFETAVALRKCSVRLTGLSISATLARGGFRYLLGQYERELSGRGE